MKISIITATYNSARTLRDTLDSILAQTHTDYELVVVDGASTDGTLDIIRSYEPRFGGRMRWVSEPDGGLYDAMNKGVGMATGDAVGILNSDDFYASPEVLAAVSQGLTDAAVVFGHLDLVDPSDTSRVVRRWRGTPYTPGAFRRGWHPAHPTFYARRGLFGSLGGFDTTFDVSADFELMMRFIEKGGATTAFLPMVMVKMRTGGASTGSLANILRGNRNVMRAFRKNGIRPAPFYLVRRLAPKAIDMLRNRLSGKQ